MRAPGKARAVAAGLRKTGDRYFDSKGRRVSADAATRRIERHEAKIEARRPKATRAPKETRAPRAPKAPKAPAPRSVQEAFAVSAPIRRAALVKAFAAPAPVPAPVSEQLLRDRFATLQRATPEEREALLAEWARIDRGEPKPETFADLDAGSPRVANALWNAIANGKGPLVTSHFGDFGKGRIERFERERAEKWQGGALGAQPLIDEKIRHNGSLHILRDFVAPPTKDFFIRNTARLELVVDFALRELIAGMRLHTNRGATTFRINILGIGLNGAFNDYDSEIAGKNVLSAGWHSSINSATLREARDAIVHKLQSDLNVSGPLQIGVISLQIIQDKK